jgi:hypothetical protein
VAGPGTPALTARVSSSRSSTTASGRSTRASLTTAPIRIWASCWTTPVPAASSAARRTTRTMSRSRATTSCWGEADARHVPGTDRGDGRGRTTRPVTRRAWHSHGIHRGRQRGGFGHRAGHGGRCGLRYRPGHVSSPTRAWAHSVASRPTWRSHRPGGDRRRRRHQLLIGGGACVPNGGDGIAFLLAADAGVVVATLTGKAGPVRHGGIAGERAVDHVGRGQHPASVGPGRSAGHGADAADDEQVPGQ